MPAHLASRLSLIRSPSVLLALFGTLAGLCGPARAAELPDTAFKDCADCPQVRVVPPGRFLMGAPQGEPGQSDNEGPVHMVTIARPFVAGVHPVTRGEFKQFVSDAGYDMGKSDCLGNVRDLSGLYNDLDWKKPGFNQNDNHPVVCVNWNDAHAYVRWLSARTGKPYRLLSEAEYEYATRAGSSGPYWWGLDASAICAHANVLDQSQPAPWSTRAAIHDCKDTFPFTNPVNDLPANAFGLQDMLGNVSALVEDCWHSNYEGAPADGRAWTRTDCSEPVVHGVSWGTPKGMARVANRAAVSPDYRNNTVGFRIARALLPGESASVPALDATPCPTCLQDFHGYPLVQLDSPDGKAVEATLISEREAAGLFNELRQRTGMLYEFDPDGAMARSTLLVLALEKKGIVTGKAWLYGKLVYPSKYLGKTHSWEFDVAPVLPVKTANGVVAQVFDPVLFDKPVPFGVWKKFFLADKDSRIDKALFSDRHFFGYDGNEPMIVTEPTVYYVAWLEDALEYLQDLQDIKAKIDSQLKQNKTRQ